MKKLKLEDLKIGMEVEFDQLSDIYDTLILLTSYSYTDNKGVIEFIGEPGSEEARPIFESGKVIASIYHDSMELDPDIDIIG